MRPTEEQDAIAQAPLGRGNLVLVDAYAGSGKTTTLDILARAKPEMRMLYLCYNRDLAEEARGRFPGNVECKTMHSLAFRSHGREYKHKLGNLRVWDVMPVLGERNPSLVLQAIDAVHEFLYSTDPVIQMSHVSEAARDELTLRVAKDIWAASCDVNSPMAMPHDGYLKLYAMSGPLLRGYDGILLDEAQDSNPVTVEFVGRHVRAKAAGVVMVGDRHQAIYGWRRAENAMESMDSLASARFSLTECFRFGQSVADGASRILNEYKGDPVCLIGRGRRDVKESSAVVARTNARLIEEAADLAEEGACIHFCATDARKGFDPRVPYRLNDLMDVYWLYAGKPDKVASAYFRKFEDWDEIKALGDGENGGAKDKELAALVGAIKKWGHDTPNKIDVILEASVGPKEADVTFSTGHRSKGQEWDDVTVLDGFVEVENPESMRDLLNPNDTVEGRRKAIEEINLIYVAATRARRKLTASPKLMEWLGLSEAVKTQL